MYVENISSVEGEKQLLLTDLLLGYGMNEYEIQNEQPFYFFARMTSIFPKTRCVFITEQKYLDNIDDTVSMVITTKRIANTRKWEEKCGVCIVDSPRDVFFSLLEFYEESKEQELLPTEVGEECNIAKTAVIADRGVSIGKHVTIEEFVVIESGVTINDYSTIRSGSHIGAPGFNLYSKNGQLSQIRHNGIVIIGEKVTIGSNSVVERGLYSYGKTEIHDEVQIGCNVCIGHNSRVGMRSEICAGSVLAGYVEIGKNAKIFINASIKNAVCVGDDAIVDIGSVVIREVETGTEVFGNPARRMITPKKDMPSVGSPVYEVK